MYNEHNYDAENWESLVQEGTSSSEYCNFIKDIFHKDNKDSLEDIYGGYGPNAFGGHGVVKHARIEETTNLLGESVQLLILTIEISDISPGSSFDYIINYPIEVNVSSDSSFLELIESIQENKSCVSDTLKYLSRCLISSEEHFIEEQIVLVSSGKRAHLFPLFCQAIRNLQVFVHGTIAYSCRDMQPHFFLKRLEIRRWLHDGQEEDDSDDWN
ncbi:hypothetical protein A5819_000950 [Enterococcus sp. 7E2_DIV0204]|uniref:hypothetical protein n=1 Tax=unclassified Enterococcus TaxID=2608891 RepID=UPI000A33D4D4|nr:MULTISPECIES: hypothetical protein [unclassified Enterococcus]OTN88469.1 hypothetical protein A5819_000950 [Enterococcus sp. 7E2_DIV0204]OTP50938.1 hypothetical protein A5884_000124 [Enterococcus sp. 7D2_DIV0200]